MKSPRLTLYSLLPLIAAAPFSQSSAGQPPNAQGAGLSTPATAQIEQLMAAYHRAVTSHDGARLASMFIDKGSWFNVLSDPAFARARAANAVARKVRPWSFQDFAKVVSTSHAALDPSTATFESLRMARSPRCISSMYSSSTGSPRIGEARPGSWSKEVTAGR